MSKIKELNKRMNKIVQVNKVHTWKQSWMWSNDGAFGMVPNKDSKLINYFLISDSNEESIFLYNDIDDLEIRIEDSYRSPGMYSITFKGRYESGSSWEFDEDEFENIAYFVEEVITKQYQSVKMKYNMLKLPTSYINQYSRNNKIDKILG